MIERAKVPGGARILAKKPVLRKGDIPGYDK
jgi:hypothetical protein